MAITVYKRAGKAGGGVSDLDGIDGSLLLDGDFAFVMDGAVITPYLLDADSGSADDGDAVIAPDVNAGTKRWLKHMFASRAHDVLEVRDVKALGTAGGSSIVGFNTRAIQTVALNEITGASLGGSNDITLPAGTYDYNVMASVGNGVGKHKVYLYNVTSAAFIGYGLNAPYPGISTGEGTFTLAAPAVLNVRHYTQNAVAATGLGEPINSANETYLIARFARRKYV